MKTIAFRPCLRHGTSGPELILDQIEGEAIDYGLVMHPNIAATDSLYGMTISCPVTGYYVAGGDDREHALRNLDELVREAGGWGPFLGRLGAARARILNAREAAAKIDRLAPVLPAIRGALGIQEATP